MIFFFCLSWFFIPALIQNLKIKILDCHISWTHYFTSTCLSLWHKVFFTIYKHHWEQLLYIFWPFFSKIYYLNGPNIFIMERNFSVNYKLFKFSKTNLLVIQCVGLQMNNMAMVYFSFELIYILQLSVL